MKRVTVNAYQVGLVFKRGVYHSAVKAGRYWLMPGEKMEVYDITKPFQAPCELNILLADAALTGLLHVVEVADTEIVLQYENGLLKQVLTAGRYPYWESVVRYTFVRADISKADITEDIDRAILAHKMLVPYVRSYTVENHEMALLFVDGKYVQVLSGGVYYWWKNNIPVYVGKADIRQLQVEINGQEILTRDKAALRINAWAQYKVADIEKALLQNKDYERQLYILFQLALREYIAGLGFDELLEKKETLSPYILQAVSVSAAQLGVAITGFGIRDIILPGEMKEIMNQVLIAEKKAQSNIIMRREETASTVVC